MSREAPLGVHTEPCHLHLVGEGGEALPFLPPEAVRRLVTDYALMVTNLSHVQERCTELLNENRELREKLDMANRRMSGWDCKCGSFNSSVRTVCRHCGANGP